MLIYKTGSLFDSDAEAFVNPVNTRGVSGKGLAQEFKRRYPDNFAAYVNACHNGAVTVGKVHTFIRPARPLVIFNFPTKDDWRQPSQLAWIEAGLHHLSLRLVTLCIKSVAVPALGCGLGGLAWADVKPLIESKLGVLPLAVEVYEPQ